MTSAKPSSTFYVFELYNQDNLYCCGWVSCFLVSRPFRSRDEFCCCTELLDVSVGVIHTK